MEESPLIRPVEERTLIMELRRAKHCPVRCCSKPGCRARQIAEALEYAQENGIIHRDLKHAYTKVALEGRVKILEVGFNLA